MSARLYAAVRKGDIATVTDLLIRGVSPNFAVSGGWTPLITAAAAGHSAIVHALLEHGSDVNAELTEVKQSSLLYAASLGHYDIVVELLQHDAVVDHQDSTGTTPLYIACQEGHESVAAVLVDNRADINLAEDDGETPLGAAAAEGHTDVVALLAQRGAHLDQADNGGVTPLMRAAQYGNDGCVTLLLDGGAQADLQDNDGVPALVFAVREKLASTALLLLDHTTIAGDKGEAIFHSICKHGMVSVAEKFLEKLRSWDTRKKSKLTKTFENIKTLGKGWKLNILKSGLRGASEFGHDELALMKINEVKEEKDKMKLCEDVMKLALMSDKGPVVKVVVEHIVKLKRDIIDLAIKRKVPVVIDILLKAATDQTDKKRLEMYSSDSVMKQAREQIENFDTTDNILMKVPKSEEIEYFDVNQAFMNIVVENQVQIDVAIRSLRAPKIHLHGCSQDNCDQHQVCSFFVESKRMIKDVLDKLGEEIEIFRGTYGTIVGSIKEETRVGAPDEIDTLVQMDNSLADNFVFDENTQEVTVNFQNGKKSILEPYTGPGRVFDGSKFYNDYIKTVFTILQNYEIPDNCPLSQQYLHISISHEPCMECLDIKYGHPVFLRCKHANNSNNNQPTLCHSKVGLVLHFGWRRSQDEEWLHRIDIDLTCPKLPTRNVCDGQIVKIQRFLQDTKPVGWLEEFNKLMATNTTSFHLIDPSTLWLVQMRKINNDTVIARQMVPFMHEGTLKGAKIELYILLKILKTVTNAPLTSFSIKYAVDRVFKNVHDIDNLGEAALRIMNYRNLKDKWHGIHPKLEAQGYKGVDLDRLREGTIYLVRNQEPQIQSIPPGQAGSSVENNLKADQQSPIQEVDTKELQEFKQNLVNQLLEEDHNSWLEINNLLQEKMAIIQAEMLKHQ